MNALIVDDEKLARKRVLQLLESVSKIKVIGECSNGKTAIETINQKHPDLVFLDINMKDMNGFDVLRNINVSPKPIVVFVTAYDNYALKAFDVDAFDFLLKPFKDQRFYRTIDKVLKTSSNEADENFEKRMLELFNLYQGKTENIELPAKFLIKQGNKTLLISPHEIMYISASGSYAELYVGDKKYVLRESLNNLCDQLDSNRFFRIHRSTIVNLEHVKEIVHSDYSELDARMTDNSTHHISKSHKQEFFSKIGM